MFGLGTTELLIILAIVMVLFGASRLPQLANALGTTVRSFRRSLKEAEPEQPSPPPQGDESKRRPG